jgi:hypothetical protein
MANTQTSSSGRQRSAQANTRGKASTSAKGSSASAPTVASDGTYGIVSVLYHALQGADTIDQYIEDARESENEELVAFFEDCKAKQNEIALEGKRLLAAELTDLAEDEEDAAQDGDDE